MSLRESNLSIRESDLSLREYLASNKIPIKEIKSATNNFADKNLVKRSSSSKTYKARLKQSSGEWVDVVVRMFTNLHIGINEIVMTKDLRHENIVPTFKISEGAIINKYEANESLDKHLSSSTLSWMQRLHICVGIARALSYLHYDAGENHCVIHGNIKSSKILLDHDWEPKLHGFGFAVRAKRNQLYLTDKYNGSLLYMDPAYETTSGLTHKSDVFSFGVVLFEVLFGRDASSVLNTPDHNDKLYFARLARDHYEEKTLDEMIDPNLREQMNLESLNIFSEIAYFCLKEQRSERPDMKKVFHRLEGALDLQRKHASLEHSTAGEGTSSNHLKEKTLDHLKIRLSDIKLATNNFSDKYCIGSGGFAMVYKAELDHFDGKSSPTVNKGEKKVELPKRRSTVAIKRIFYRVDGQAEKGFLGEIELLSRCKHPNIVSLIGFCNEEPEIILIYEYATNGSLEEYLGDTDKITNLTWARRIKISIDIAHGLHYLHKSTEDKKCIIHRDIKSANILLDDNWKAKISDFGLSKLHPTYSQRSTLISGNIGGTQVYLDPEYEKTGYLKTSSDIYSFGVVLCEIMFGNLAYDNIYNATGLPSIVRQRFNDGTIEELVDPHMKESGENTFVLNDGLNRDSLYTFSKIAIQCVAKSQAHRPTMEVILKELEKSLNLQWFSLGSKGKRNVMISARAFSYTDRSVRKWQSCSESRFQVAAQMLDISNLKIRIKLKPEPLLAGENYGVYLVFKLLKPRKCLAKHMYVNLKYKWESNNLHADFATWREDGWMMIELCRILNYEEDTNFEIFLESFSQGYCGRTVYIEGIEFQTIDKEYQQVGVKDIAKCEETQKSEDIKKLKEVRRSCSNMDKGVLLEEVQNEKICFMLSEMKAGPYKSSLREFYTYRNESGSISFILPSAELRFQSEIELLKQQVFGIKGKFESQMLSPDTDYMCYLVFELSEKCDGLHCPVKVRHGLQWKNKEIGLICFRPRIPWNLRDTIRAPRERDDGCMEVIVWKFNSTSELRNDHIPMNLKFITYEGTMSGLIVCGLEIRSM